MAKLCYSKPLRNERIELASGRALGQQQHLATNLAEASCSSMSPCHSNSASMDWLLEVKCNIAKLSAGSQILAMSLQPGDKLNKSQTCTSANEAHTTSGNYRCVAYLRRCLNTALAETIQKKRN